MVTPFTNPERQFRVRRDTSPAPIHNIFSFYESVSSESEFEDVGEIDIETLTLEQYLALNLNNTHRRINNHENTTFERSVFKRIPSGNSTENAIEHIEKVLEIASLFITNESTLLRVFPLTLVRIAKRCTTMSNALANLGASISVMPFSLFKRLELGNPKPINMVIEMADRSMQSLKGMIDNVLVKISKFVFLVDFVILDIVEDDKVLIILGRPMLATAHARIDVFGKISL
ncbi:putative reverse transcriptase, RNA-dependent DNA polymerase [Tanacetum coccineum]